MNPMKTIKIPSRTITYTLIYTVIIFIFILLVIYPHYLTEKDLDENIISLNSKLEEQKILFPVYRDLAKKTGVKSIESLPMPETSKLVDADPNRITLLFQKIADGTNLELKEMIPDVESFVDDSGLLKINIVVKGNFLNFRKFMIKIAEVPYYKHLERFQIRKVQDASDLEFDFDIWLERQ